MKTLNYILGGFFAALGLLFMFASPPFGIILIIIGLLFFRAARNTPATRKVVSECKMLTVLPKKYVVLDSETTGLNPASCEILEIAAIRYDESGEVERFQSYVKPTGKVPSRITELTGIKTSDVRGAPLPSEVAEKLAAFVGDDAVAGYNVSFDISFIQTRMGITFSGGAYDVLPLARSTIRGVRNHKLQTLKEHLGLELSSHRAMADCETTRAVICCCEKIHAEDAAEQCFLKDTKEKFLDELRSHPEGVRKVDLYLPYPDSKKQLLDRVVDGLLEDNLIERGKVGGRIIFTAKNV